MSSGDHSHKKRTPSPNPHDLQHDTKRHKGGAEGKETTESVRSGHSTVRHKNGKKSGNGDEEFETSIRFETSSQAIHGMDEKYMQELVETIYRLRMPKDFFDFWDFCCRTNPMNPRMALSGLNIELVGPFDILAGDVDHKPSNLLELQDLALLHWRYFYDVPEFQTVLRVSASGSQLHYGYFRDDPTQLPVFVASNDAVLDCKIHDHGGNLFAAVHQLVLEAMKTSKDDPSLKELEEVIRLHASKFKHTLGLAVDTRAHRPAISSLTWHGAGIVANPDSKETHSLEKRHHITPAGLHNLLTEASNEEDIHEEVGQQRKLEAEEKLLAYAKEMEKDVEAGIFETTLEFGIALFCFGNRLFHKQARAHLVKAYGLLNRDLFAEISNKHVDARVRGDQLTKLPMK